MSHQTQILAGVRFNRATSDPSRWIGAQQRLAARKVI